MITNMTNIKKSFFDAQVSDNVIRYFELPNNDSTKINGDETVTLYISSFNNTGKTFVDIFKVDADGVYYPLFDDGALLESWSAMHNIISYYFNPEQIASMKYTVADEF